MSVDKYQRLAAALDAMIGQVCWSVLVSEGLDNGATISLGDRVPRDTPLDAPNLTAEQRAYAAAFELSIADCTWRLDSPDAIVTSWSDDDVTQDEYLGYLVGQPVTRWEITWPGLDLTLHFANDLSLRLFCDQTDPADSGDNYALLTPNDLFNVGVRSALTVTRR